MGNKFSGILVKVFLSVLFLFGSPLISYTQIYPWNPVKNFTSGHIDKNPVFGTKQSDVVSLFNWEFLAFERHADSTSDICVLKVGTDGPVDSVIYITKDNESNRYPSISYNSVPFYFNNQINNSLILWESHKNGRSDIYASYYNSTTGWQPPFPIDTSNTDKHKPRSVHLDSASFGLVYEKDNDIIFKIINANTHVISYDTNLTFTENAVCENPFIINLYNSINVSYEKKKPDNKNSIEVSRYSGVSWSAPDTVAYEGDNINNGFSIYFNDPISIFTSDRLGNKNIYGTALNSFEGQKPIIIDTNAQNYDYESYLFPVVTDGGFYNYANAYIKKSDSLRIIFSNEFNQQEYLTISDSTHELSLTMNGGIRIGTIDVIEWVVFNKDSLSYSGLYGKSVRLVVLGINQISSEIPHSFKLFQNYPNPFNPVTKIRFDIAASIGNSISDVKLIIYDGLGREVEKLVDDQFSSGTYEVTWDASKYSSGVYFYKLVSGDFISSKKLLLLK